MSKNKYKLTPRESEVARMLAKGEARKSICAKLHISVSRIRNIIRDLCFKFNCQSTFELVATLAVKFKN
jgi:DNA-binding CsgD family transcriptional regulator